MPFLVVTHWAGTVSTDSVEGGEERGQQEEGLAEEEISL